MRALEAARCGKSRVCSVDWVRGFRGTRSTGKSYYQSAALRFSSTLFTVFLPRTLRKTARKGPGGRETFKTRRRSLKPIGDTIVYGTVVAQNFNFEVVHVLHFTASSSTAPRYPLLAAARGNIIIVITRNASFHLNYTLKHSLERAHSAHCSKSHWNDHARGTPLRRDNKTMQILPPRHTCHSCQNWHRSVTRVRARTN